MGRHGIDGGCASHAGVRPRRGSWPRDPTSSRGANACPRASVHGPATPASWVGHTATADGTSWWATCCLRPAPQAGRHRLATPHRTRGCAEGSSHLPRSHLPRSHLPRCWPLPADSTACRSARCSRRPGRAPASKVGRECLKGVCGSTTSTYSECGGEWYVKSGPQRDRAD